MRIAHSARKHGVSNHDIRHALPNGIYAFDEDEDVTMVIGPAFSGALLEVGVLDIEGNPTVIHAMAARSKYLRHLP